MQDEKLTRIQREKINALKNVLILKNICKVVDVPQGIECISADSTLVISITEKNLFFEIFTPDRTFFLVDDIETYITNKFQEIEAFRKSHNKTKNN